MDNREKDTLIAESIMGWHWVDDYDTGRYYPAGAWLDDSDQQHPPLVIAQYWTEPWEPTENVAQAIKVMESLRLGNRLAVTWSVVVLPCVAVEDEDSYRVCISTLTGSHVGVATTIAMAACDALIKVVQHEQK